MAALENILSARLLGCQLTGSTGSANIVNLVRTISVRESICSPYITAELIALDNDNQIPKLGLEGGSQCMFKFDAPGNSKFYQLDMYILDIKGTDSPENIGLKIYTISLVSSEYFTDQRNTVSRPSDLGMTGCVMAQSIWSEVGGQLLIQPIQDMPLRDGQQPFHVDHVKPLTAIGQIRDIQVYPDKTGNVLLYRNIVGLHHVPLYFIYMTCSPHEVFIQRETWGINFLHMFGADMADHSIVALKEHSRATMLDKHAFKTQTKRALDQFAGKFSMDMFKGIAMGAGQNFAATNSDRTSAAIDFTNNMDRARIFASCMKAQPQYTVTVPLRTGINMVAGVGCQLDFMPTKDKPNSPHPASGLYLTTDLIHEVHHDLRNVQGTTVLQVLRANGDCLM